MPKQRISIPSDVAADVMFASDATCCKCRERGKAVQIHHIDENPSDNHHSNLAVLCLQCHDETQVRGGFGRRLNASLVVRFRDECQVRVVQRREAADQLAIARVVGVNIATTQERADEPGVMERLEYSSGRLQAIERYVTNLPQLRADLSRRVQPEWDTGVTARMVQASYDYIDGLQGILVSLTGFYPNGSFANDAQRFFSDMVARSFTWHREHLEPYGRELAAQSSMSSAAGTSCRISRT